MIDLDMIIVILVPFLGTVLGSLTVFFMKEKLDEKVKKALIGFAAGVMIAASVWSLIIPSIEESFLLKEFSWFPAVVGFLGGMFFLLILDSVIPHLHLNSKEPEGLTPKKEMKKSSMFLFALTLHNIPEGIAVGIVLAGVYSHDVFLSFSGATALAVGIAIQNFPESAIVSMPLRKEGLSKSKAFLCGVLSGIVEPIAALITIFLAEQFRPFLPYVLSFAAGAMIYVVVEELIPEAQSGKHTNISTMAFAFGFALMLFLDVYFAH